MYKHFENIKLLYGSVANVRLPNNVFKQLSTAIKSNNGSTNIQQVTFAYVYLITISFLYKYTRFIDIDNGTYIQNSDLKELLGYNRSTKTIDKIIKKDGILDQLGLTKTTKNYPIRYITNYEEKINNIAIKEFITINDINSNDIHYNSIKDIIKNRNYVIKEPLFLTTGNEHNDYGTLYSIERTHKITIDEFLSLICDEEINNIDFMMYGFFKSRCKGFKDDMRSMALFKIILEMGINRDTFYEHLKILKEKKYIVVNHKGWKAPSPSKFNDMEANEYFFKGV